MGYSVRIFVLTHKPKKKERKKKRHRICFGNYISTACYDINRENVSRFSRLEKTII